MKYYILLILILLFTDLQAQNTVDSAALKKLAMIDSTAAKWSRDGYFSIILNQVQQKNWVKGGESTVSGATMLKYQINLVAPKYSWNNTFDFGFGILKQESFSNARKSEDIIDVSTKLGFVAFDHIYYSTLVNFKSQFANGYAYPNDSVIVSKFFSPAYMIFSVGIDWKPDETFSLYISPITGKHTYVLDDSLAAKGTYTGIPGETFKADFGAYFKASIKRDIWENVTLISNLSLFNNYTDKVQSNRANIDVDWNSSVVMKINKFLNATIFLHTIYDHDIDVDPKIDGTQRALQIKEAFGLGISFKF